MVFVGLESMTTRVDFYKDVKWMVRRQLLEIMVILRLQKESDKGLSSQRAFAYACLRTFGGSNACFLYSDVIKKPP